MKRYSNNYLNKLLLITAVVYCSIQCTKVDSGFGSNLIPDDSRMDYTITTISGFEVSTISVDSMRVDHFTNGAIGSYVSQSIGKIDMAYTTEINTSLASATSEVTVNMSEYVLDTIVLKLKLSKLNGLDNSKMLVDVYDLKTNFRKPYNNIYRESAPEGYFDPYFSNFDYTKYINEKPLTTIEIDVLKAIKNDGVLEFPIPKEWGERAMKLTKEEYRQDSTVRKVYKGLTFVPRGVYAGGNLLSVDTGMSNITFDIYNKKDFEESDKKSTLFFTFDFTHINESQELYNQMVTTIDIDESYANTNLSIPESVVDDKSVTYTDSYISGMGNIISALKFPKEELDKLKKLGAGSPTSSVIVTNATLYIPVTEESISDLNRTSKRLATFYQFDILDYMPDYYVDDYGYLDAAYFGGYFSRNISSNIYEFGITRYVQDLLNGKSDNYVLQLAPSFETTLLNTITNIDNSSDNQIKLKITYAISK